MIKLIINDQNYRQGMIMRKMLIVFILTIPCHYISGMVRSGVEVTQESNDDDDEQEEVWIGPGWYYGVWIDDEAEFRYWNRQHHWHRYDGRHHGGGHDGRHHEGGHHGGRHGGKHH